MTYRTIINRFHRFSLRIPKPRRLITWIITATNHCLLILLLLVESLAKFLPSFNTGKFSPTDALEADIANTNLHNIDAFLYGSSTE